jgi:CUG-BP- and ETR3-like factor
MLGVLTDVVILKDRHSGAHKGCGFVCYSNKSSADLAIQNLADKCKLPNAKREMIVRYAGERVEDKEYKLYVCMLSRQSTEAEIRQMFQPYGELTEVFIIRSREGNQSKGAAFVKFTNKLSAEKAVAAIHEKVKDKVKCSLSVHLLPSSLQ